MSRKSFKEDYTERVHSLLWRQWARLGVAGPDAPENGCIVDPEALLLFTFEVGRSEPRLYDEVLDWLSRHERLVNIQRLRNLSSEDPGFDPSLAAAPARWLCTLNKSSKWRDLAKTSAARPPAPFFTADLGRTKSLSGAADPHYQTCGWSRPPIHLRGNSSGVPVDSLPALVLRLRFLFGLNARAEVVAYLLAVPSGHPTEMARELAYSQPSLFQVCREMAGSALLFAQSQGRQKRYRLDRDRWSAFLGLSDGMRPSWGRWPATFRLLIGLWRHFQDESLAGASDYMAASRTRLLYESLGRLAADADLGLTSERQVSLKGARWLDAFHEELLGIFARDPRFA
jgi:hypothetical protein